MQAHKLQVKVFAAPGPALPAETFIPIFHDWIKRRVLPDLMIDVANYGHVPKGPGVVLIGHAYDMFMDDSEGRPGLLYNRKRGGPAPEQRLGDAFRHALHGAMLLEAEPSLRGKLRFSSNEFLFRINDRLLAPNSEQTFAELKPELNTLAVKLFEGPYELARVGDSKGLLSVRLVSAVPTTLTTLLARLPQGA